MIVRYQALAQRIRLELDELDRVTGAMQRHWRGARTVPADQDAYLNSVALNLHNCARLAQIDIEQAHRWG